MKHMETFVFSRETRHVPGGLRCLRITGGRFAGWLGGTLCKEEDRGRPRRNPVKEEQLAGFYVDQGDDDETLLILYWHRGKHYRKS